MSKIYNIQTGFTAGELSPRLLARVDLEQYVMGCKTMVNAYPLAHGGATRRRGTKYVGEIYDSTEQAKLISYVFSKDVAFLIVINGGKIQFINNGAFIESGGSRVTLTSPWAEIDLDEIRYTQLGSDIYLVHPDHAPRLLTATAGDGTTWSLTTPTFEYRAVADFWYETDYASFKILNGTTAFGVGDKFEFTEPATSATLSSGPAPTGNGELFGIYYGSRSSGSQSYTVECVYADPDRQEFTVTPTDTGMWGPNNYPSAVGSFEQRLYFGGMPNQPQTIMGSKIRQPTVFTVAAREDDGIQFTVASSRYDQIVHLEAGIHLLPFSSGGEFSMQGGDSGITPTAIKIRQHTQHGANGVKPIRIGQEYIFVQRGGSKARAVSYSFAEDVNVAPDITLLAEHITDAPTNGFVDAAFAQDPDYIGWFVRSDGVLTSLTHLRDNEATGWSRHVTDGLFETVGSIPNSNVDDVYHTVVRVINGSIVRYIEYFDYTATTNTDCSLLLSTGSPQLTTWTGLDHLEGKIVDIVADDAVHPQTVVSGGAITLDYAATEIEVGLHYETIIELQHPQLSLKDGTTQGRPVSVSEVVLRLQDTMGAEINGKPVAFRAVGDDIGEPVPLFTGDKRVHNLGWDSDTTVTIEQKLPRPFTLLGVILVINL